MEWIILLKRINDTNSYLLKIEHLYVEESKKIVLFFYIKNLFWLKRYFFV